jgi:hypothetical protein
MRSSRSGNLFSANAKVLPLTSGVGFLMKSAFSAAALCVGLTTSPLMAADGILPGLWKITTAVVNNGMKLPSHTNVRCLTVEQVGNLADTFSPRFGGMNSTCERTQYVKSEQKLTWRLECRGQFNMDTTADFTFFSPIHYTAVISTKSWIADQQLSDSKVTLEGEYAGGCQQ